MNYSVKPKMSLNNILTQMYVTFLLSNLQFKDNEYKLVCMILYHSWT